MHNKKFIDFIITQNCTYNCSYCSQSKSVVKNKTQADVKTINSFLNFLDTLASDSEITITGGEAILHSCFFELVEKISKKGFKINLITNLSFKIETYNKIFQLLNENLNRFDISIHLEQIDDFEKFYLKLEKFLKNKPKNTKTTLLIPVYNIDLEKEKNIEKIVDLSEKYRIGYDFQHIRFLNKYKNNTEIEEKYLKNFKKTFSYAKYCNAGFNSCVIYENGEAYRCYSSRFKKSNYLGNINNKDFSLKNCAKVCTHKFCTCPKPLIYNQIVENKNIFVAKLVQAKDLIFLPFLIIKNLEIIKTKLKHYFIFKNQ